ncbi:MAG: thioredoxin family protein [Balneolaceae bacterium]|nr:thioredoxin family protein [Balneolaceae bacterium]
MSATPSTMLDLGTRAPDFQLTDALSGREVSLDDYEGAEALLVVFMCNHCPYVKHILPEFVDLAREYASRGVEVVAVSSNDVSNYPDDRPEKMKELGEELDFPFPYLYDESQEVARRYRAACTPDFFLFDSDLELVYRGQFDESRPGNDEPVDGSDLREALDLLLEKGETLERQKPSMGCNIKWKAGNEPDYFA